MVRALAIVVIAALAGAAAGFFIPRLLQWPSRIDFKYRFPDRTTASKPIAPGLIYACTAVTQAEVYENREAEPTANVGSGKGGDEVSFKISDDKKGILVAFPFAAAADASDVSEPLPIVNQSGSYVVASRASGTDIVTVFLDVSTLKAIYTYTGQGMVGIRGRSLLLACR